MTDTLAAFFKRQRELMEILEVNTDIENLRTSIAVRDVLQGVISEAVEVSDLICTSLKPWKSGKAIDLDHMNEEVVDIFFMWMETCIMLGISPETVEEIYKKKFCDNLLRFAVAQPSHQNVDRALLVANKARHE